METKAAEDDALIPFGRITSLQFSLATSDEIIKVSRSEPIQLSGQLSGPLLGLPTESHKCSSCGTIRLDECEGHFGHIRLPTPVFHPSHIPIVVRILKNICLNCFKLKKKKKIMNYVKKILPEKKPISYGMDLEGTTANNLINCKRKNSDDTGHNATSTHANSNSEEDPLLRSLIPRRTYVQCTPCTPIKRNPIGFRGSKNFKFIKEIARSGLQQTKQSTPVRKRNFSSSMSDAEYNKEGTNCKYCMDVGKQSVQRYPKIDVKIVNAKSCNNEEFGEIKIWLDKDIPLKFWDFVDRYSGYNYEDEASRTLLPFEALNILRQVPVTTSKRFGVSPESLIWDCLPVPPNCTRISGDSVKATRVGIDGATKMLKKIINVVGRIKESRGGKPSFETRKHETKMLQLLCSQYLRARGGQKIPGGKGPFEVHGKSLGNAESFSKIWGERITTLFLKKLSRFSARGVLTGDAYIEIDEIGIPLEVAKSVTVEERITLYNKERMQSIVNKGLYSTLVDRGGTCRSKEFLEMVKTVEIGEIVHRQLADGDIVIVNRPPSIHKHSIQALKVRIQPSCNFSISPLICPPMDADFDGDCIHVFVPQSLQSRAELSELLSLDQQLVNSQSGQMLLMLTQDTLIAASLLLSMPLLNELTMHQLSMWALSAVPEPAIIRSPHGGPYWTGCQLFQMCLPRDFNCNGNGLYIQKSQLLCILQGGSHSHGSVELILHTLMLQKGPKEALKFLNSMQHTLTEWLSQDGLSVGLDDVHPFHDATSKKCLVEAVSKCFDDVTPLMNHTAFSGLEDAIVPYVQNYVHHTHNRISKCIFKSNSLIAIVEAGSGRSVNKVIQQTGFLGLQIFKGNELLPREWSNRLYLSLNINSPLSAEVKFCEARGLILSSITNGLKPHEAFIHAISSREALFCKAIEVKEPGRLSKQLMAFLRDIIICYDGTIRTTQGKHLVQFQYDSGLTTQLSELKGEKTKLRRYLQPGDPVGIHAATALTNPSYKVLLDSGQENMSSWYLLKESLTRRFRSKLQLPDQNVILRLRSCCCNHAYCLEKIALQIQNHLQNLPLKMFSISIEVGYQNTGNMEDFDGTSLKIDSSFVGHIRLDKELLRKVNLSKDSLLLNLKRSIKTNGNPLNDLSDRLVLQISENCEGVDHKEKDIQMPCLHFYLQGSDSSSTNENIWDTMIDEICPKLLETTAKGDDRIEAIRISWSNVNSASWVPLQISMIEGEIIIEATIDRRKVKQRGDAWKIVQDACLPIMELLNTKRCIPYSIHEIYKCFGVSAAYYLLLQRLSHSINMMGSHVYKEDLVLIANCMSFSGIITGFNAAGYRELLHTVGISAPFTEGALEMPLKCFEKAAERGEEERLSSTLSSCSWGQHPSVGTGGNFEVLWNYAVGANDPSGQLCKHEDIYDFLENMGMIPCGKEASSLESCLDENLCDEIDDTSEVVCSDVIFVDSPMVKGMANCKNCDLKSSWDIIAKSPDQTDGWEVFTKPNSQADGWEGSKKPDSQIDGWVCPMAGKDASNCQTTSQLSGWEASIKPDSQTDGWEASTKPDSQTDGWEASTKPDSQTDGWEASTKLDSHTERWGCGMAEKNASKCQTTIQLSGWESSTEPNSQTNGWEVSTKPISQTNGWEASTKQCSQTDGWICSSADKEASKCPTIQLSGWGASTKPDSNTDDWEASINLHSKTEGWVCPMANNASKCQTTIQLSGWEASTKPNLQTNGWETSTKQDSQTHGWICSMADKEAFKCQTLQLSGWEASTKPDSQADGWEASTKPDSNTDGWEASTKLDSQTEGWVCPMADKKASKCQTTIQLSGWSEASTKPNSQTNGWEISTKQESQTDGWICSMADKEAFKCQTIQLSGWDASTKPDSQADGWEASRKPDSSTDGWEASTKLVSQTKGWVCSMADEKASKCRTTIPLSGWEASTKPNSQTDGWEASTKPDSQTDGWICSMVGKEASKCQTNIQLSGWEASTKPDSQTDGWELSSKPDPQADGWEASTKRDSKTNGWVHSMADKKAFKCQKTIQLSGWESSTKPDSQIDGWVFSMAQREASKCQTVTQLSGWEASTMPNPQPDGWVSSIADKKASRCQTSIQLSGWEASTKLDSQTDGWEASTKLDSQTDGWVCSMADKRATKGEMSIQLSGWEASTGWNSNAEIVGAMSTYGENPWDSKWQHDEVRNFSSWVSNLRPEGERHCTAGSTKIDNYRMSREKWTCSEQEKDWKIGLQEDDITNLSGWNSSVETSGGKGCSGDLQGNAIPNMSKNKDMNSTFASKKRARETGKTENLPCWNSNKDTRGKEDYTDWNNRISERIHQKEMTGMHDNQHNHFKSPLPRFQKTSAFQGKGNKRFQKKLEGNYMENKCRSEGGLQKDPPLPPGFSFQEDSSSENKFLFQQNGNENTGWPSSTDILTNSSWGNCAKEESEHKLSFSDVMISDNRFKVKNIHASLVPPGESRSFRRIQTEAHGRNTSQKVEQNQKIRKESQATGWDVNWQVEVQEASSIGQQPIMKSMHVESNIQDTPSKGKSLTTITSCHVSNITDEDATTNRHSSVNETNDKVVDLLKGEHFDGWDPYSETIIVKPGWEVFNNKKVVSESFPAKSLSTDNLASPTWGGFSEGEHDKCDRSFSGCSHKFKQTGANIVPLGTRSYRRAQPKEYDRNIQGSIQDQAVMKVMQPKERLLGCPVEETRSTGWTTEEPDGECKHAEFSIQNTLNLEKETIPSKNCHKPRTSRKDTVTPSNCNMETEENVGLTVKQRRDSDGWNQRPETITVRPGLKGWHDEQHVTYDRKTPTTSGWEVENVNTPVKKSCMKKGMEEGRTSKGAGGISSFWSTKKDKEHRDYKNRTTRKCAPRSCNTKSSVEQTSRSPSRLQGIFQDINPLLHSTRTILHFSSYNNGDRLRPEHEREILEKVLIHHPEAEGKMGCGVDFIMVDSHSVFTTSKCFYIVRKDGTRIDFSYFKCLKGLVEKKYPDSAKAFIEKYLAQRK